MIAPYAICISKSSSVTVLRFNILLMMETLFSHLNYYTSLYTLSIIELIKPPTDTVKKSGFLKEEFYANDATHANAQYGLLVLNQLTDMLKDNE